MIADWSAAVVVVAAREVIVFGEGGGEGNEVGCAVIASGRWVGKTGTAEEEGDGIAGFVVEDGELMRCNKERSETDPLFARCGGDDGAAAVELAVVPDKGTLGDEDGDAATATSVPWGWGTVTPVAAAGEVACETCEAPCEGWGEPNALRKSRSSSAAGLAAGVLVLPSG
ncbi:BZ3500_MvSof-1268-A1-R1_Chr8-1g10014 [Microbotryum saponariae]|uniref:BZ3500_MvSof-1268-A1-R1_Chr8-1g10014 protein n=1 Tax=Microbotryum saponariae TaxID=289078 RepID=A0A2X0LRS0_9BASI|nr:BZ3500_MvSof-1268-A1-R1_Chr8-1g10014 [Microbotryum saponariae]SDA08300.1 BZ3501_MvSof-1269-A2-R1_Chr8-1g09737 [Microbotryum saponariae]